MQQSIVKITLALLVLTGNFTEAIENSVIPLMEKFECIENLPSTKFTINQMNEIRQALDKKAEKIRLVSYNMLFDLYDHDLDEVNRWPNRLPRIVELINEMHPDIISTQELYPNQVQDILDLIGHDFSFYPGQKDEDGESYGIFYRTDRFKLLCCQMNDPLSMVQLKDLKTDKIICVFNTHMPFSNIEKRELHAHKISQMIEPFAEKMAVIFSGDLNTLACRLELTDLPFYDGDYIHRILTKGSMKNAYGQSLLGHFGPLSTFTTNGIDKKAFQGTGAPGIILDYIYVSDKITVLAHAVERATVDGHFPSDHLPVLIDFLIN